MSILQKKTIKLNDIEVIRLEDCQEHFELFKEIFLDPEIMKTTMSFDGEPAPNDECVLRALFLERIKCNQVFDATISVIVKKNNHLAGLFLCKILDGNKQLEIGHYYKPLYFGSGISSLVGNYIIDEVFDNICIDNFIGYILIDNLSSQAIALKNVFKLKKIIKKNNIYMCVYQKNKENTGIKIDYIKNIGYGSIKNYIIAQTEFMLSRL